MVFILFILLMLVAYFLRWKTTSLHVDLLKELYPYALKKYKKTDHYLGYSVWSEIGNQSKSKREKMAFYFSYYLFADYDLAEFSDSALRIHFELKHLSKITFFLILISMCLVLSVFLIGFLKVKYEIFQ